jgi:hypothetical protein
MKFGKNESYNVVISTNNYYRSNGSFSSLDYAIDWSFLPEQAYKVHFTYLGGVNNLNGSEIANLFIDLGATTNTYNAGNNVNALTSSFLGVLKPYVLGTSSFLLAEDNTNVPIYINGRPRNNVFTVNILDNENTLFAPVTVNLAEYKLMLRFVPYFENE